MSLYSIPPSTSLFPSPLSVRFRLTTSRRHVSLPKITVTSSISVVQPSRCRACELFDLHDRLVPYKDAWDWQRRIVKEKKALVESKRDCPDTLIVLQHRPVYTMGTGSSEEFLNINPKDAPFNVYRTERGGEVTYHGPGQLVMYPIVNLQSHKMDLHWYLRSLEEFVIRALSSAFSLEASRLKGLTGVWIDDWKLAAIWIRVSQWIAYHGLALNVTVDLTPFRWVVPCGIRHQKIGSIKCLLKEGWTCGEFGSKPLYHADYTDSMLIDYTYKFLIKECMEVVQLKIYQNQFGPTFEGVNC